MSNNQLDGQTACPIMLFFPVTADCDQNPVLREKTEYPTASTIDHFASALMAIDHFNQRSNEVVKEIGEIVTPDCQTRLSVLEVIDSKGHQSDGKSSQAVIQQLVQQTLAGNGTDDVDELHPICALSGVQCEETAFELAASAASLDIPVSIYGSKDSRISASSRYPYVARTAINNLVLGKKIVAHLIQLQREQYITIMFAGSDVESSQIRDAVVATLESQASTSPSIEIVSYGPGTRMETGFARIQEIGYRTVILIPTANDEHLLDMATAANGTGLLDDGGDEYYFIVQNLDLEHIVQLANENEVVVKLLKSSAHYEAVADYELEHDNTNSNDPFLNSFQTWIAQPSSLELLQQYMDDYNVNVTAYYSAEDITRKPARGSAFAYDAIMTVGLGACQMESNLQREPSSLGSNRTTGGGGRNGEGGRLLQNLQTRARRVLKGQSLSTSKGDELINVHRASTRALKAQRPTSAVDEVQNEFMKGIYQLAFTGASGYNIRDPFRRRLVDRDDDSITLARYNFVVDDEGTFVAKISDILPKRKVSIRDMPYLGWETITPFVYRDGSTNQPLPLRNLPDNNYLSSAAQATVLTLGALVLMFIAASTIFVCLWRKHLAVRSAQPEFLISLLAGAAIFVSSIFALSFDEEDGASPSSLSTGCAISPWLLVLGYVTIHCSLFSKLWRIDRVLQFQRGKKISVRAVLWPFVLMILAAISLLSAWTALDPLQWRRVEIDIETGDSSGSCESENGKRFWIPIAVLMAIASCMTYAMAWFTRDVDRRFAESNLIFMALFVQVQILIVGLPVLFLVESGNTDVVYVLRSLLILLIGTTAVVFVVFPKVKDVFFPTTGERKVRGASAGVRVTGASLPSSNKENSTPAGVVSNAEARPTDVENRSSGSNPIVAEGNAPNSYTDSNAA